MYGFAGARISSTRSALIILKEGGHGMNKNKKSPRQKKFDMRSPQLKKSKPQMNRVRKD